MSAAPKVYRVVTRRESVVCDSPKAYSAQGHPCESSKVVADLMGPLLADEVVETFQVLMLNAKHRIVAIAEVGRGTVNSCLVHPREVFGPAIRMGAAAIIVVHNHPSGDPQPSHEDVAVTRPLAQAAHILGIPLLDHVVVGELGAHRSLRHVIDNTEHVQ